MKEIIVHLTGKDALEHLGGSSRSGAIMGAIIGIGFLGWIVTMLITGRVIASVFWPIWLVIVLGA